MGSISADFSKLRSNIGIAASLQAEETEEVKIQAKETNKLL